MTEIYNLLSTNIYLYICIVIVLLIIMTILFIVVTNQKNRRKIKNDFVEAEKIETELEQQSDEPNELEAILKKMQDDIDIKPEDVVKKFEEEQEEKAIISYKELIDNVKAGKVEVVDDDQGDINYVENLNVENPVEHTDDDQVVEETVTPEMIKEAVENISGSVKEEPKKFKNSEFISPIYGVMQDNLDYPRVKKTDNLLDLMNTKDYNELTEEIKRQEEFLEALKAFRNNL